MLEKPIEKQILTWLNYQQGVMAFKVNTVGIYDAKRAIYRKNKNPFVHLGTSDIIGLCDGIFFCIEVKTVKTLTRVTDEQIRFINQVKSRGGYGIVATDLSHAELLIASIREQRVKPLAVRGLDAQPLE